MTPVDQEFHIEEKQIGDCVRAATASLLDLKREEVPHFVRDEPGNTWYDTWEKWIKDRGHSITVFHQPWSNPPKLLGYYLASGHSNRGTRHMIVMKDGVLSHDPHPSRTGLIEIEAVWLIK